MSHIIDVPIEPAADSYCHSVTDKAEEWSKMASEVSSEYQANFEKFSPKDPPSLCVHTQTVTRRIQFCFRRACISGSIISTLRNLTRILIRILNLLLRELLVLLTNHGSGTRVQGMVTAANITKTAKKMILNLQTLTFFMSN